MSIWSDIFSGGVVTKGMEMADDAFHTSEEKGRLKLTLLKLYEPYKLIQRLLALIVTIGFVGLHLILEFIDIVVLLCVLAGWADFGSTGDITNKLVFTEGVTEHLSQRNIDTLGNGWEWVMIWYFSGGLIEGGVNAVGKIIKRRSKDNG